MNLSQRRVPLLCLSGLSILLSVLSERISAASAEAGPARLKHVGGVTRDDLQGVVGLAVSPDGKHLYAAAFHEGNVTVFGRDSAEGGLTHVQTIQSANLGGVTSIQLSRDGRYAATAAFGAGCVVLYERDGDSGKLKELDRVTKQKEGVQGLDFAIRVRFAPDGKLVYVLDGERGGVTAFEILDGGKLKWMQTLKGEGDSLAGSRGLAVLPDGKRLVTANYRGNTLAVLDRDPSVGTVTVRQVLRDEENGMHALEGAFGVATSADGKFVYTSSGRFQGDQAVCAFEMKGDGTLTLLQEFTAGQGNFAPFRGGNDIVVSPDGRSVYAVATESGSLACFDRDTDSGRLTCQQTLTSSKDNGILDGAAGLACSPDGRFVYAAAEFKNTISIYRRATSR